MKLIRNIEYCIYLNDIVLESNAPISCFSAVEVGFHYLAPRDRINQAIVVPKCMIIIREGINRLYPDIEPGLLGWKAGTQHVGRRIFKYVLKKF